MYSGPLLLLFTQSEFPQGTHLSVSFPIGWAPQTSDAPLSVVYPTFLENWERFGQATHTLLRPLLNLPRTHSHFFLMVSSPNGSIAFPRIYFNSVRKLPARHRTSAHRFQTSVFPHPTRWPSCILNIVSVGIETFKAALSDRIAVQKFAKG
jgi:hypothetical protein